MTTVDFYDKDQADTLLNGKADKSDTYTKTEVNTALNSKANASDVYTKAQIDNKQIGDTTDSASSSGTLWARIKYVLAHWLTADTEQTVSAKKTFSVSPEVPSTPATPESAVNSVYVNNATAGVNNIVHKTGAEAIAGKKTYSDPVTVSRSSNSDGLVLLLNNGSIGSFMTGVRITWVDSDSTLLGSLRVSAYADGRARLIAVVRNKDGTTKEQDLLVGDS